MQETDSATGGIVKPAPDCRLPGGFFLRVRPLTDGPQDTIFLYLVNGVFSKKYKFQYLM